ncbi:MULTISPECIES: MarR family winged helix-turn-helix transcriptional regulator [Acutalibacteraceae]|uniref:MarR family winged helix-turn-helix transcriptional regulator n=1 Tax=Acutalibacteraceae TaxID=3082771 RepID=UPI00196B97CF|nr:MULTISPECIES: MarR family transcriptional regulator [Acutalibacteraceae]
MDFSFCINYLLTVAQHEIFMNFAAGLAPYGITPGQYGVLNCLWTYGPCTPKEIAKELRLENSTISGVLDRMQKRGVIDRELDPNDRRSIQVVLTEEGKAMKDDVLRVIDDLNDVALSPFTQQERDTLIYCLRKIGNVESHGSPR